MLRVFLVCAGACAGLCLLNGCTSPPTQETKLAAPAPAVIPAPTVRRAPSQPIHTDWSFRSGEEECVANAVAAGSSLRITVRRNMPVRLLISLAPKTAQPLKSVPVRFSGPAGAWEASAHAIASRKLAVSFGLDETALSRILVLLSGGGLDVGEQGKAIATFAIGQSGDSGRSWFDCARSKVL